MRLDRTRPFQTVSGFPGAAFMQDGHLFNAGGAHVEAHKREVTGRDADGVAWKREENYVTVCEGASAEAEEDGAADGDDLHRMHWKALKVLCDQYDHPFTTKAEAIEFLEGHRA